MKDQHDRDSEIILELFTENTKLKSENAKLREALEYIAAYNKPLYDAGERAYELSVCQERARQALRGEGK
jgi:regulator of replication initiation timing